MAAHCTCSRIKIARTCRSHTAPASVRGCCALASLLRFDAHLQLTSEARSALIMQALCRPTRRPRLMSVPCAGSRRAAGAPAATWHTTAARSTRRRTGRGTSGRSAACPPAHGQPAVARAASTALAGGPPPLAWAPAGEGCSGHYRECLTHVNESLVASRLLWKTCVDAMSGCTWPPSSMSMPPHVRQ